MAKIVACIIARTNSSRLPKKVLRDVGNGMSLIEYIINKIKKSKLVDEIYMCTSVDDGDKILLDIASKCGIKSFAGSRESVIDRMIAVAEIENAQHVIRITGDNIFTDEVYLDIMIKNHLDAKVDYTRTEMLPIGITPEIMEVEALRKCYSMMDPSESQYLMLYMFQPEVFNCLVLIPEKRHQRQNMTLTVDTPNDFERTLQILGKKPRLINLDGVLERCEEKEIPNAVYDEGAIVKFPANLLIYFSSYRNEMNWRIKKSRVKRLNEGTYLEFLIKQANV